MPAARRKVKVEETPIEETEDLAMPLPQINKNLYTPALVVLLIIASFLLGDFYAQLNYLKGGKGMLGLANSADQTAPTAGTNASPAPSAAPVVANVATGDYPAMGDDNAPVTIVEFADLRCPFCKQTHDTVIPQIKKDYVDTGKAKIYFRNWAFLGDASTLAAEAGECANEQGKWWDFEDYMYTNQPSETDTSMYTNDNLTNIAGNLGMDTGQFSDCLTAKKYDKNVQADYSDGQKAGVSGTPTFYINGAQLVGAVPYDQFKSTIDAALKKAGK